MEGKCMEGRPTTTVLLGSLFFFLVRVFVCSFCGEVNFGETLDFKRSLGIPLGFH